MKTTYELTSASRKGCAKLTYEDGLFNTIEIAFKEALNSDSIAMLLRHVPVHESDVGSLNSIGLQITKAQATNEKIALFCRFYEQHKGIKYKVSRADTGKIKLINPSERLLMHYFRSDNFLFKGKHSISNLVKYWNELRADLADQGKAKYPNSWQPELIRKLSPTETMEYYRHLRSLGLREMKTEAGQIVGFK